VSRQRHAFRHAERNLCQLPFKMQFQLQFYGQCASPDRRPRTCPLRSPKCVEFFEPLVLVSTTRLTFMFICRVW
jgi:hypothetical protein